MTGLLSTRGVVDTDAMTILTTPDDVIRAFGGPSRMAVWAGVTENGVCWYRHRGIPPALHLRLIAEAKRRGWRLDPVALFELDPQDIEVLTDIRELAPPAA